MLTNNTLLFIYVHYNDERYVLQNFTYLDHVFFYKLEGQNEHTCHIMGSHHRPHKHPQYEGTLSAL